MRKIIEAGRSNLVTVLLATALVFAASLPAGAQSAQGTRPTAARTAAPARAAAASPNELVVSYLSAWSERDARRRRELIAKTWTDGGRYTDTHHQADGHDGIDALIKGLQDQLGAAYAFRLVSGIDAHHGYVRFTWAAGGLAGAPLYFEGTDVFVLGPDGRVQQVIGFTNASPAPPPR